MKQSPHTDQRTKLPTQRSEGSGKSGNLDFVKTSLEKAASGSPQDLEEKWNDGETSDDGEREGSKRFVIALAVFVLLLAVMGVLFLMFGESSGSDSPTVQASADPQAVTKLSDFLENSTMEELEESAVKAIRGFMESETLAKSTEYIVGGSKRANLLEEFYGRPENSFPNGFKKVLKKIPNTISGVFYFAVFATDQNDVIHQFVVVPVGEKMRVDWACSVAYGEFSKEAFFEKKPDSPANMRFFVEPAPKPLRQNSNIQLVELETFGLDPIKSTYPEPSDQFLRLTDLNAEVSFSARISPKAHKCLGLLRLLQAKPSRLPVQLKLVWNSELQCPEITSLEYIWWFDPEGITLTSSPFDAPAVEKMDITDKNSAEFELK